MKRSGQSSGPPALDLLDEGLHLLRRARGAALGWYYLGALPFALVWLYFWTDMSWSADARRDCAVNAAGVALAFAWMKSCQAMCARHLRAELRLEEPARWGLGDFLRMALQQAIIQPSKLFVLPVAFIATLPFAWVFAFYENATALGEAKNVRLLWSTSWQQARLWPRQNHLALGIFALLAFLMSLNLLLIVLIAPHVLKVLTGTENVFTRSGIHVFNSTILAVVGSATYLCCDPLVKAVYVLRCFYGESLQSGKDLQVELRRLRRAPAVVVALLILCSVICLPVCVAAPESAPRIVATAQELDGAIQETIAQPEFRWRMPREELGATARGSAEDSAVYRFVRRAFRTLGKWWKSFWDWLEKMLPQGSVPSRKFDSGTGSWSRGVLEICLVVLSLALLALLGMKIRAYYLRARTRPRPSSTVRPDLADEAVTADQLPEDEWLQIARDLIGKGEWRLALRALFLAGLAHLSKREMIALARHKSNRDYESELCRRAPAEQALQDAFRRNRHDVERAWYGRHQVSEKILENFQANLDTIRAI